MAPDQIVVTLGGLALAIFVAWYFWFSEREGVKITADNGVQEVLIKVKGGYSPDLIVVEAGKLVRLNFHREETALCSEQVLFPDFGKQAMLAPFQTTIIEIKPNNPGVYEFHCGMGMMRGKLIVK